MKKTTFFLLLYFIIVFCVSLNAQYTWRHRACLPAPGRTSTTSFVLNNKAYIVDGKTVNGALLREVWQYDPATDTWVQKSNYPGAFFGPSAFVINDTAYVGLGTDSVGNYLQSFWKYNASADQWTPIAAYPGSARNIASTFVINGMGYVGCGLGLVQNTNFYAYNPALNIWVQKASLPGPPRQGAISASINGYGYVGTGWAPGPTFYSDFYRYNPVSDSWIPLTSFATPRECAASFVLNDTLYVLNGDNTTGYFNDCWRYDSAGNIWVQLPDLGCVESPRNTFNGFTLNGHGYVFGGGTTTSRFSDLLEYGPEDIAFTMPVDILGIDTSYCGTFSRLFSVSDSCALWSTGVIGSGITVNAPGTYWVRINDSCGVSADTIHIASGISTPIHLGNDTTLCLGQTMVLRATTTNATYQWQDNSIDSLYQVSAPGRYSVTVTTLTGCSSSAFINISYNAQAPVVNLGNDTTLCQGQTLILQGANLNATYHWQDNATDSVYLVSSPGVYSVTVSNALGCSATGLININYTNHSPVVYLGNDTSVCGSLLILKLGIPGAQYHWQDNSTDSFYIVKASGKYSVTVSNNCGSSTDSVNVRIYPDECDLLIPTGFSPNGDGKNDVFRAISYCPVDKFSMRIYNRWGELVFESNDINAGWDGTFKQAAQPIGVFVYYAQYFNYCMGQIKAVQGTVTLLR